MDDISVFGTIARTFNLELDHVSESLGAIRLYSDPDKSVLG